MLTDWCGPGVYDQLALLEAPFHHQAASQPNWSSQSQSPQWHWRPLTFSCKRSTIMRAAYKLTSKKAPWTHSERPVVKRPETKLLHKAAAQHAIIWLWLQAPTKKSGNRPNEKENPIISGFRCLFWSPRDSIWISVQETQLPQSRWRRRWCGTSESIKWWW